MPTATATRKRRSTVPEGLSRAEFERLMDPASVGDKRSSTYARDRMLLELLAGTGLRINEALSLTRDRIDLADNSLWVLARHSKNKQGRVCYFGPTLAASLTAYLAVLPREQWLLFVTRTGKALSDAHVRRLFKKVARRAEIDPERLSPHILRHSFATRFLGSGGTLEALRDALGHSHISVTAGYLRCASWHRKSEAERLDL
jgi:site-specific recombinase XerD